jgi:hypothetical protein
MAYKDVDLRVLASVSGQDSDHMGGFEEQRLQKNVPGCPRIDAVDGVHT